MTIVPQTEALTIEARVLPQDIDQVTLGQAAIVRLSAFNQRTTPELKGTLSRLAADLSSDPQTGQSWYTARIHLSEDELRRLGGLSLLPGMPAEAHITTESRTAFSYL